jgi:hypothetical protein
MLMFPLNLVRRRVIFYLDSSVLPCSIEAKFCYQHRGKLTKQVKLTHKEQKKEKKRKERQNYDICTRLNHTAVHPLIWSHLDDTFSILNCKTL